MPWSVEKRENKWCVVKEGGEVEGCHASRTDAIKQQRALYSSEARVASMYAELDAMAEEIEEQMPKGVEIERKPSGELVRIEIGKEHDALIASLSDRMEAMAQQQAETQLALVATLQQIGLREQVVNVAAPNVNVEPPNVNVEPPSVTVQAPDVTVQAAAAPNVTVNPEIVLPDSTEPRKKVTFVRDPFGKLEGAEITEE